MAIRRKRGDKRGQASPTSLPAIRPLAQEIAQYLAGSWREEHLFNLASALRRSKTALGACLWARLRRHR
jgi:hypothetical protein